MKKEIVTKRRKIQTHLQEHIDKAIADLISGTEFVADGIKGYIADTIRGRANSDTNEFTVPFVAFSPKYIKNRKTNGGYFIYYVAHELSHLLADKKYDNKCHHDAHFYEVFKQICPVEYQHFELEYKKTAAKYGIKKNISKKYKNCLQIKNI